MEHRADVLIVTVTKVESRAVLAAFEAATGKPAQAVSIQERVYRDLGILNGSRIYWAQSEMGSSGLGASLQAVQKGIAALRPAAVIMIGIAFGIDEHKQKLGDILVSRQLMLYELQRVGVNAILPRGDRPHASTWLLNLLNSADLDWNGATVRFGLLLSGEKLVDHIDYRGQLQLMEREAIGGEMEGAGLYAACQEEKVDWVLVKAICDWADGNKGQDKDARQQQAAKNAAEFVVHALRHTALHRSSKPLPSDAVPGPFEQVRDAFSRETLSEALLKLEFFAREHDQAPLAEWAQAERDAYTEAYIAKVGGIPDYRSVSVQWQWQHSNGSLGYMGFENPQISGLFNKIPLPDGTSALESYRNKGYTYCNPGLIETVAKSVSATRQSEFLQGKPLGAIVTAEEIESLLSRIRSEAQRRLFQIRKILAQSKPLDIHRESQQSVNNIVSDSTRKQQYSTDELDSIKEQRAKSFHEQALRMASKPITELSKLLLNAAQGLRHLAGHTAQYGQSVSVQHLRINHRDVTNGFLKRQHELSEFLTESRETLVDFFIMSLFQRAPYVHHQIKLSKESFPRVKGIYHSNTTAEQLSRAGFITAFTGPDGGVYSANDIEHLRGHLFAQTARACWNNGLEYARQCTRWNPAIEEFFFKREPIKEELISSYLNLYQITETQALTIDQTTDYRADPDLAKISLQPKNLSELAIVLELLSRVSTDLSSEMSKTDRLLPSSADKPQELQEEIDSPIAKGDTMEAMKIFVSYSHKDVKYLEALKPHLRPLVREGDIDLWDDSRIHAGARWKDEIENALKGAKVGILLISKHFLASDFIDQNELPPLLDAANNKGVTILQIIVSPCMIPESLSRFQMINSPNETITQKNHANREKIYLKVAEEVKRLSQQKVRPQER